MTANRLRPSLPTGTEDVRLVTRTIRLVLGLPRYAILALLSAVVALSVFVLGQNIALAEFALTSDIGVGDKATILFGLYPFLGTNYSLLAEVLLVVVATLTGVNISMVVYHFREHGVGAREGSGSAIGVFLGALGAGCAACGSALFAGILSLFGVAGVGTLLPLDGIEFSLLALVVLLLSIYWVADGMRGGEIRGCPI